MKYRWQIVKDIKSGYEVLPSQFLTFLMPITHSCMEYYQYLPYNFVVMLQIQGADGCPPPPTLPSCIFPLTISTCDTYMLDTPSMTILDPPLQLVCQGTLLLSPLSVATYNIQLTVTCYALYSRRLARGTRQPSGTPLKNTFKHVINSRNWSSRYIWI